MFCNYYNLHDQILKHGHSKVSYPTMANAPISVLHKTVCMNRKSPAYMFIIYSITFIMYPVLTRASNLIANSWVFIIK